MCWDSATTEPPAVFHSGHLHLRAPGVWDEEPQLAVQTLTDIWAAWFWRKISKVALAMTELTRNFCSNCLHSTYSHWLSSYLSSILHIWIIPVWQAPVKLDLTLMSMHTTTAWWCKLKTALQSRRKERDQSVLWCGRFFASGPAKCFLQAEVIYFSFSVYFKRLNHNKKPSLRISLF